MKEVAQILKVSEKAIMFHKYRIMASFNLKNNSELVLFALKHPADFLLTTPHDSSLSVITVGSSECLN
jgi:Bacterial regulatory proteins, luxR family